MGSEARLKLGKQWRIQDFPEVGAPTLQRGANIEFCQNFPKTKLKNLDSELY